MGTSKSSDMYSGTMLIAHHRRAGWRRMLSAKRTSLPRKERILVLIGQKILCKDWKVLMSLVQNLLKSKSFDNHIAGSFSWERRMEGKLPGVW